MPTLDPTVGGAAANTFVSAGDAEAYFARRLHASAWDNADEETRQRALVQASDIVTRLPFVGRKLSTTQAMAWPRDDAINPDEQYPATALLRETPVLFATDVIPERVKRATCELALALLRAGSDDPFGDEAARNVAREKVGPLETEYVAVGQQRTGLGRYPRVMQELAPLLRTSLHQRVTRG